MDKMKLFEMRCPNCRYNYRYQGAGYEVECCPNCGHFAPFKKFVVGITEVVEKKGEETK